MSQRSEQIPHARRIRILEVLCESTKCEGCDGPKSLKKSHCRACYLSLPRAMQKDLYKRFGAGYEEAYEESLAYLKEAQGRVA